MEKSETRRETKGRNWRPRKRQKKREREREVNRGGIAGATGGKTMNQPNKKKKSHRHRQCNTLNRSGRTMKIMYTETSPTTECARQRDTQNRDKQDTCGERERHTEGDRQKEKDRHKRENCCFLVA